LLIISYNFATHFKNKSNYFIADITAFTRAESKNYNLVAITSSGLRAFVKLDFKEEDPGAIYDDLQQFYNVYVPRPSNTFTIAISPIAEHSKSMKNDRAGQEARGVNDLSELIEYKSFFSFGRSLFSHINNSSNNFSSLELIENDESVLIKSKLDSAFDNNIQSNVNSFIKALGIRD
jgi:hypothetical protein